MDNRYRGKSYQQDNRNYGQRSRQDEQFSADSDDQYGDAGWRTQENERWQSGPDFDRGYGRNDPFTRDWSSAREQRSDTSSLEEYDRSFAASPNSPQRSGQRTPYGRPGNFGADGYRSDGRRSGGIDHIPPRRYDRDDRGFFDRASDEVMSWFGDDDAARRRQLDSREDHRGKGPVGYIRSNERLLEEANERLMHDSALDASAITVTCEDNEITLTGTVDSRSAKRRAEDIVDDISGVKHVQNNLRVSSGDSFYSETSTLSDS